MARIIDENKSIIGKIAVSPGDIVLLKSEDNFVISGFVVRLEPRTIQLSYENPHNKKGESWSFRHNQFPFNPARRYELNAITSYEILKKHSDLEKKL